MHQRVQLAYAHNCCAMHNAQLGMIDDVQSALKNAFDKAIKFIHSKGSFTANDLNHNNVKPLINELNNTLLHGTSQGINMGNNDEMTQKMKRDVFVFSGMKTYAQLKEASLLLLNPDGSIKPFAQFSQDIHAIYPTYNDNYLRTEYNYAINSASAAAKYKQFKKDGDNYNLQIRTAEDDKVRPKHKLLDKITLPFTDEFWNTHWIPFDWGCRCTIVQVLTYKYTATDNATATKLGNEAVPPMFRYNPAKQGAIFPPKHPYFPQHCKDGKVNLTHLIGFSKYVLSIEEDRCKAMKWLEDQLHPLKTNTTNVGENKIITYPNVPQESEHEDKMHIAQHFAKMQNEPITILPKFSDTRNNPQYNEVYKDLVGTIFEGKQPDLKVGNKYYELEGYTTSKKENALANMIQRGADQSENIIIGDSGANIRSIKRYVYGLNNQKNRKGKTVKEVWIKKVNGDIQRVL